MLAGRYLLTHPARARSELSSPRSQPAEGSHPQRCPQLRGFCLQTCRCSDGLGAIAEALPALQARETTRNPKPSGRIAVTPCARGGRQTKPYSYPALSPAARGLGQDQAWQTRPAASTTPPVKGLFRHLCMFTNRQVKYLVITVLEGLIPLRTFNCSKCQTFHLLSDGTACPTPSRGSRQFHFCCC